MKTKTHVDIDAIVSKIGDLPAVPEIVAEVIVLTEEPETELADVAAAIEKDPALAAKVLKISNSSYYGMRQVVGSLRLALVVLGIREVRNVVLGIGILDTLRLDRTKVLLDPTNFWDHSFKTGGLVRRLTAHFDLALQGEELAKVTDHNNNILTEQAEHYAALQFQVVELTQDRTDATRRGRLTELAARFPIVNIDEESPRCLYSAGSEMTDADFELHIDTIERYAAAAAVSTPMVPIGMESHQEPQVLDVETARYAAEDADRALEIVNECIRKGDRIDYKTAVEKAQAERAA